MRICGVLDQVSDASSDCRRLKAGDQVITERRRSIGNAVGCAIWRCMGPKGRQSVSVRRKKRMVR